MASEARALAKKIAQPGQADGPVLQALMALDPLVATEANRKALIEERFLSTLTGLLQRKQEMVISGAITLINSLSLHEDMQTPLAGAGLGEGFARLLQSPQFGDVKVEALTTLANVLNNESIQWSFQQAGGIAPLVPLLSSPDAEVKGHAYRVAIGVSQYYEDIQRELGAKSVSLALASLTANADDKEQKVRAARLLLNLAFVEENVHVFVREKSMPALLRLVQSPDRNLRSALVKLLVNLAGTEAPRRALLEASALQMCTALLQSTDAETQTQGAKLLTNLSLSGRVRKEVNEGPSLALFKRLAEAPNMSKDAKDQLNNALFNLKFPYERTYTDVKLDEASLREVAEEMERIRTAELEETEEYTLELRPSPRSSTNGTTTALPVHAPAPANARSPSPRPFSSSPALSRNTVASPTAHHYTSPTIPPRSSVYTSPSASNSPTPTPSAPADSGAPLTLAQRKALLAKGSPQPASPPAPAVRASTGGQTAATAATSPLPAFRVPSTPPPPAPTSSNSNTTAPSSSPATYAAASAAQEVASSPEDKGAHDKKDKKKHKEHKDHGKEHKKEKKEKKEKRKTKKVSPDELVVSAPKNVRVEATEKPLELSVTPVKGSSSSPALNPSPRPPATPSARTPRSKLAQQLQASTTRKVRASKPPEELEKRRANIAKELLYTENTYVKNMQYLLRKYYQPLALLSESKKPVLKAGELKSLFANLGAIVAVHTMLLESLAARITAWTPQTLLGDLFISTVAMLKVYVEYVNNFENSIAVLNQLKTNNAAFAAFLVKAKEEDTENQHDVEGYLIQPVQRIPRYELLLSDLSRYTPESHPDSTALRTAVQKIRETAAFIDAERGKFEKLQKLSEIMRALGGKVEGLFVTGRTCVAEADVKLSGDREGYAWLFNDSIIAAEKKSGLLRSATLQLKLFVLFKDALFGTSGNVGIYVKCKDKDECVMAFSNPDERNVWLTLCNKGQ